jgi:hypothetical protein
MTPAKRGRNTKSASESSSCPIMLLFFRQRATLPSRKSKNRPKGRKASASQRSEKDEGSPMQYRSEENMDSTPQRPVNRSVCVVCVGSAVGGTRHTVQLGDKVGEMHSAYKGEVARLAR